ncbi:unnamed protein product, partial [Cyprideis torosa]
MSLQEIHTSFILGNLLAGGVAGMVSKTSVAPLDRVKILLQAHQKDYAQARGVFSCLASVFRQEGLRHLYKGNGAQMVRIFPYAALQFTSFEIYKRLYASMLGPHSHAGRFMAGSCAGVTAVTITYPLDVVRARLAFQGPHQHLYRGIADVLRNIFLKEGGLRGLFRGYLPTIAGMIPYAGLSFYCFETMKYILISSLPSQTTVSVSGNTGEH